MIAFLIQSHQLLARSAHIFTLLIAGYALLMLIQRRDIGGDFWGAVIIGEALIVLQSIGGAAIWLNGIPPMDVFQHVLYGIVAIITWPATFAFTQGSTGNREKIIWLVTSVFLWGVTLRAAVTGG